MCVEPMYLAYLFEFGWQPKYNWYVLSIFFMFKMKSLNKKTDKRQFQSF